MKITNRVVEDYLNCRYKAFLGFRGEIGKPHDYEVLMSELTEEYRPEATEALLRRCKLDSAARISSVIFDDLQQGHALVLDCTVETNHFHFHFDALKRMDGESSLGSFHYTPVMFVHEDKLRERHRQILACEMFVVGRMQQQTPKTGFLVVGKKCGLQRLQLGKRSYKTQELLEQLSQIIGGSKHLGKSKTAHWLRVLQPGSPLVSFSKKTGYA